MLAMSVNTWLNEPEFINWKKSLGDTRGVSPEQLLFCWSCAAGKSDLVSQLLSLRESQTLAFKADFNNDYALRFSAQNGHLAVVKMLCRLPECDPKTNFGYCLTIAAENGDLDMAIFLAEMKRANKSGTLDYVFETGDFIVPLSTAARKGKSGVVEFFCDYTRPIADDATQKAYVCQIEAKAHEAIKDAAMHNQRAATQILAKAYATRKLPLPPFDKIGELLSDANVDRTLNFSWQGLQSKSTDVSKEDESASLKRTSALKSSK